MWSRFLQRLKRLRNVPPLHHLWLPVLLLLAIVFFPTPLSTRLDLLAYDFLSRALDQPSTPNHAVVIAIDDASLQRFGPWPWPRQRYADLLSKLNSADSGPVAFAILLDTEDRNPADDNALAEQISRAKSVIFPVLPAPSPDGTGILALHSLEKFRHLATEGHVDVEIDPDGVSRRIFLNAGVNGHWWPPLALASLRQLPSLATALPKARLAPESSGRANIWQRDKELLLRNDLVGTIRVVPYDAVMDGAVPAESLRGKAIFIGVTASGANSALAMANTPDGVLVPAVEYHARVFEALLRGAVLTPANRFVTLLTGLVLLLIAYLSSRRTSHHWRLLLLAFSLLPAANSFFLIHLFGLWTPPVAASLALTVLALSLVRRQMSDFENADSLLRQQTRVAMESIADGVIVINGAGLIEQVNGVTLRLLGQTRSMLKDRPCVEVLGSSEKLRQGIRDCLDKNHSVLLNEPLNLPSKPICMVRVSIGPVLTKDPKARGAVLVLSDITPLVMAENRLKHQATHDPLTGLPNRTLIQDRLQQLLAGQQRRNMDVVVLFLDLDRFKHINDGAGHPVGDEVLRTISQRLRSSCRSEDTVGRWGGDEFVILLSSEVAVDHCQLIAYKLIHEVNEPISIAGGTYHLGASIGIAMTPTDSDKAEELIRLADLAMYRAKAAGGDRFAFVSPGMNRNSSQRLEIEIGLRQALKQGEFEIYYQPQVAIGSRRLTGLEALIRWNRPGFGLTPPDQFIPIAEESGLINEIGAWVLNEVGRQMRDWRMAGASIVPVAVNVSARQCQDMALVDVIRKMLARYDIPARQLEIEITETAAVQNLEYMTRLLGELSKLGVKVAIDDFGTGYSSLAHLKCLPISVLKIDKSFVSGTPNNHEDRSICRATIALAHSLGMKVVAEGIENEQQREFLDAQACDMAQGFLFRRPVAAAATLQLLLQAGKQPPESSRSTTTDRQ